MSIRKDAFKAEVDTTMIGPGTNFYEADWPPDPTSK